MAVAGGGVRIAQLVAVHVDVQGGIGHILNGSNGQNVAVQAGSAQHAVVGIAGQVLVGAPGVAVAGVIVVAGGDAQHHVGFRDQIEVGIHVHQIVLGGGEARGRTQGQVDHIGAQQLGVFQGCQNGSVAGALATETEDLHGHQLGIGSHAHHIAAFHLVGGGNAGNVGAVVALGIQVMGKIGVHVGIVEAEDHLGIDVNIGQGQIRIADLGIEHAACQGFADVLSSQSNLHAFVQSLEIGMVGIQAGIDDGDDQALAAVAVGPGILTADHHAVVAGQGHDGVILAEGVGPLQQNVLDAVHGLDLGDLAVGDLGRNTVQQPGVVVVDLQGLALQDIRLDLGDHIRLSGFQGLHLL